MYVVDTNIISLFDKRRRQEAFEVINWLHRNDRELYLSVITLTEIQMGILKVRRKGMDQRADELSKMLDDLRAMFQERILPVNIETAIEIAHLAEHARQYSLEMADLIVAATAKVHGFVVLTRNLRHFLPTGVAAIDPLAALPPDIVH
jgi:toxin FitB